MKFFSKVKNYLQKPLGERISNFLDRWAIHIWITALIFMGLAAYVMSELQKFPNHNGWPSASAHVENDVLVVELPGSFLAINDASTTATLRKGYDVEQFASNLIHKGPLGVKMYIVMESKDSPQWPQRPTDTLIYYPLVGEARYTITLPRKAD